MTPCAACTRSRCRRCRRQRWPGCAKLATAPRPPPSWALALVASACSLVVALGIGLQFTGHGTLAGPPPDPVLASVEDNGALYDENPDLYLWLGDTDLAME